MKQTTGKTKADRSPAVALNINRLRMTMVFSRMNHKPHRGFAPRWLVRSTRVRASRHLHTRTSWSDQSH